MKIDKKHKRKINMTVLVLMVCSFVCGCTSSRPARTPNTEEGERISLVAIITKPEEYDGVRATVRGILRAEEEGIALYMFEEDAEYESHISALWLGKYEEIKTLTKEQLQAMNGKYVGVTGSIAATKYGPTGDYNCEMTNIENVAEVEEVNPLPSESPGE